MNAIDLAEIKGIRPKRLLADAEELEVPSQTTYDTFDHVALRSFTQN